MSRSPARVLSSSARAVSVPPSRHRSPRRAPPRSALFDAHAASARHLAGRLREHYPELKVEVRLERSRRLRLVVNATPLGMKESDPLPLDIDAPRACTFVGEVVMKQEMTPLCGRRRRGCRFQVGTDMLFEQIPAYLEFFGFGTTTPEELRAVAKVGY